MNAAIITETDELGTILSVNENFCDISGYSEKELLGKNHRIVNSGTHSPKFFGEMWDTIKSGHVWQGEICNRKKSGGLFWVHATIFPIVKRKKKKLYRYAALRFDITEKKEAELKMQSLASNYKSVIEVTDGFCHITASGQFIDVSDGYCHLSGYSREELLRMNVLKMDEDFLISLPQLNEIIKEHGKTLEIQQRRKNGSIWQAEITASYSTLNDGTLFFFLHDVTKRKEIENKNKELQQQLNHMQKLDSIGCLTAGIAHDFNNILAGIMGYNEINKMILDERPKDGDKTNLMANQNQIDIAIKRGTQLIDKLLIYSRQNTIKAISGDIKPTAEIIKEAVTMLKAALTSKYKIELALDEKLFIQMNETDLHQVITNLIVNARDAMPTGQINISLTMAKDVDSQCSACLTGLKGDFIELRVSDNGSGMDKKIVSKIFDPFFTTKEVGKGTGLGLSVVNGLVRAANGHFIVESTIGVGTTFRLLFPIENNNLVTTCDDNEIG